MEFTLPKRLNRKGEQDGGLNALPRVSHLRRSPDTMMRMGVRIARSVAVATAGDQGICMGKVKKRRLMGQGRLVGVVATLTILLCQTGCMGTLFSRSLVREERTGAFAGRYPYQALGTDCSMVWTLVGKNHEYMDPLSGQFMAIGAVFGFVSLPCDLVFDTVLLPADLIAWPLGFEKRRIADTK